MLFVEVNASDEVRNWCCLAPLGHSAICFPTSVLVPWGLLRKTAISSSVKGSRGGPVGCLAGSVFIDLVRVTLTSHDGTV